MSWFTFARRAVATLFVASVVSGATLAAPEEGTVPLPDRSILHEGGHAARYALPAGLVDALVPRGAGYAYDVLHIDLDLDIDFDTETIAATSTLSVSIEADGLASLTVDLHDALTVDAVTVDGGPVSFARVGHTVEVDLGSPQALGTELDVAVTYHGEPVETGNKGFKFRTRFGEPVAYTLSTPFSNPKETTIPVSRTWRACKDDLTDKSTIAVHITTATGLEATANGVLTGTVDHGDGTTTHSFLHAHPIAPYLVTLAVSEYVVMEDTYVYPGGSMPMRHLGFPDHETLIQTDWAGADLWMGTLAGLYGEYPFVDETYGMYESLPGPAIEHQTCVTIPANIVTGTEEFEWILVHELGHMWWGDHVTVSDWDHVWISEGFASYTEALYYEATLGGTALRDYMANLDDGPYPGTVVPPSFVWDAIVYDKGAWVAHMLRWIIGDAAYFTFLQDFLATHGGGNASTADLVAAAEAVHGEALDWFFDPWLYEEGRPTYEYTLEGASIPGPDGELAVSFDLEQVQSLDYPTYTMPILVRVTTTEGTVDEVIVNDARETHHEIPFTGSFVSIEFDPDGWILADFVEGTVGVPPASATAPLLGPATPNPVRGSTSLAFSLQRPGRAALRVFDVNGRHVATLHQGRLEAGRHIATWDGTDTAGRRVAPGRYFVRLVSADGVEERPLTVLR
jgi:aminopeptidase N